MLCNLSCRDSDLAQNGSDNVKGWAKAGDIETKSRSLPSTVSNHIMLDARQPLTAIWAKLIEINDDVGEVLSIGTTIDRATDTDESISLAQSCHADCSY